jgi:hypothetical protein
MTSCTAVVLSRKDGERDATSYKNVATTLNGKWMIESLDS